MKSVLISIQPEWCELIASGKKTIEVRKTRPKLETPFKCYIYCTKPKTSSDWALYSENGRIGFLRTNNYALSESRGDTILSGKVIGEFVCDKIETRLLGDMVYDDKGELREQDEFVDASCLSFEEILDYAIGDEYKPGASCKIHGWHISNLKIYDQPKGLGEFVTEDKEAVKNCKHRERIGTNPDLTNGVSLPGSYICRRYYEPDWCNKCHKKFLTRPPQSWMYAEEIPF